MCLFYWIRKLFSLLLILGLFSSVQAATDCSIVAEIPQTECETLVNFYDSTNDNGWENNTGWNATNTPCSWEGITCHNGRVIVIDLPNNNLVGTLPDLSALISLTSLRLHNLQSIETKNQLSGSIPNLSSLKKLENLNLGLNKFTGSIPELSTLTNLVAFHLSGNALTGNIPDLSNLANLQYFSLGVNNLTGQIPSLKNLTKLKTLYLYSNQLEGLIPSELSELTDLEKVYLYKNNFSGSIPDLSRLTNLTDLYLNNNQLSGPYQYISGLPNLVKYNWDNNPLLGKTDCNSATEIPVTECETLLVLYHSTDGAKWVENDGWNENNNPCNWYGVDCDDDRVNALSLSENGLKGDIPDLIALHNLQYLQLASNRLTGNIDWLSNLTNLKSVELQRNREHIDNSWCSRTTNQVIEQTVNKGLSGNLPNLNNLIGLHNFKAYNNSFTGSIPDVSNLTNLVDFRLQGNNLSGDIPNLGNLSKLKYLFLGCNILSDGIPEELNNLIDLQTISLGANPELGGTIPNLSNLVNLEHLTLGFNNLTGQIPSLKTLTKLKSLYLYNNKLEGLVPSELSELTSLEKIYMFNNQLTGNVPDLSKLTNLINSRFDLCNSATEIPYAECETLVEFYNSTNGDGWENNAGWNITNTPCSWEGITCYNGKVINIILPNNNLVGSLPDLSAFTSLTALQLYNLSSVEPKNNLTGSIPNLSSLTKLRSFNLSLNNFSGSIPELNALENLVTCHLGVNDLTGIIPDLTNLVNLEYLTLGFNNLTGSVPSLKTLTKLKVLSLRDNQLTGSLPDISGLTNLIDYNWENNLFERSEYKLTVNNSVNGNIVGQDINCGLICNKEYPLDTQINLTATPNADYQFYSWGGACAGMVNPCQIIMNQLQNVTANFIPETNYYNININNIANGIVSLRANNCDTDCSEQYVQGITCDSNCIDKYVENTRITLTAKANDGYTVSNWDGDCSGTTDTCVFTLNKDANVTVTFKSLPPPPVEGNVVNIIFAGLNSSYHLEELVTVYVMELTPFERVEPVDLWVFIETANGEQFFRIDTPDLFSQEPQPFKTNVKTTETVQQIFEFELPSDLLGEFTVKAVYAEVGQNPFTYDIARRSNLVTETANIMDDFWFLKNYLEDKNFENVVIKSDGALSATLNGETHYGQLSQITSGLPPTDGSFAFEWAGDIDGDGITDFEITYPNGNKQTLYNFGTNDVRQSFKPIYYSYPELGSILNFGDIRVGTTVDQNILTIGNDGNANLMVDFVAISGVNGNNFNIVSPSFPLTIASKTYKPISMQCDPSSEGLRETTLQLSTNDLTKSLITYPLKCNGVKNLICSSPDFTPTERTDGIIGSVGFGYDNQRDIFKPQSCFNGTSSEVGSGWADIDFTTISDYEELKYHLGIKTRFNIKATFFKMSSTTKFALDHRETILSRSLLFKFDVRSPNKQFDQNGLNKFGQDMLNKGNQCFKSACGDQFIFQTKRGSSLYMAMKFDFTNIESKKEFFAKIEGDYKAVDLAVEIEETSSFIKETGKVTLTAYQIGGDANKLANIFGTDEDLSPILTCKLVEFDKCQLAMENAINYAQNDFANSINEKPHTLGYEGMSYASAGVYIELEPISPEIIEARKELAYEFEWQYGDLLLTRSWLKDFEEQLTQESKEYLRNIELQLDINTDLLREAGLWCFSDLSVCLDKKQEAFDNLHGYNKDWLYGIQVIPPVTEEYSDESSFIIDHYVSDGYKNHTRSKSGSACLPDNCEVDYSRTKTNSKGPGNNIGGPGYGIDVSLSRSNCTGSASNTIEGRCLKSTITICSDNNYGGSAHYIGTHTIYGKCTKTLEESYFYVPPIP